MSGIFGLYEHQPIDYEALASHLVPDARPDWPVKRHTLTRTGKFVLGHSDLGIFDLPTSHTTATAEAVCVCSGYCVDESTSTLGWSDAKTDVLRDLLDRDDLDGLAGLNGSYRSAVVSVDGQTLTLINDRFGLIPLFVYECAPVFAFASDLGQLQALVRAASHDPVFRFALNRDALVEWFEIGLVMGSGTLARHVTVLPSGSILRWDGERSTVTRYWRPRFCEQTAPFDVTERGEALDAALRRSLSRRVPTGRRCSISLSGGLDSRLLIGAAVRERLDVSAVTFGPDRSDDHLIASQVADCLGVAHHRFVDLPGAAAACFDLGVSRTAGMANVLDLWGLQHGPGIHATTDLLVNGIGGNEFLGFLAFDLVRYSRPRKTGYLTQWLIEKLNPGWSGADLTQMRRSLAPDAAPLAERIGAFWNACPAQTPLARVYHFYFEEKSRKSNALGVATDDLFAEPVAPFLDYDVADIALRIPPRQRMLAHFYRAFFTAHYPALAAIPYSRTGLSASASTARIIARKFTRRLSAGRSASPWTQWLPQHLIADLKKLLAQENELANLIPYSVLHRRIHAALAGDPSATMAVGQLLTLESFLRRFKPSL